LLRGAQAGFSVNIMSPPEEAETTHTIRKLRPGQPGQAGQTRP